MRRIAAGTAAALLVLMGIAASAGSRADADVAVAAPTGVRAEPRPGAAIVRWDSDADATSYRVTASPSGATCTSIVLECTVTGLPNDVPTTFTVIALADTAESAPSAPSAVVTPEWDLSAPVGRLNTVSTTRIPGAGGTVRVTIGIVDDGSGVDPDSPPTIAYGDWTADVLPRVPLELVSGTPTDGLWSVDYVVPPGATRSIFYPRLSVLRDAVGHTRAESVFATGSVAVGVPSPPQGLTVTQLPGRVLHLTWSAPPPDDAPVTRYSVAAPGVTNAQIGADARSYDVAVDPPAGMTVHLEVRAFNALGYSDAAEVDTTAPTTAPSEPRQVAVTPGDHRLAIAFRPPRVSGGQDVTSTVRVEPGHHTCVTTTWSCVVDGLVAQLPYTVTVEAENSSGSAISPAVAATPLGALDAPEPTGMDVSWRAMQVRWTTAAEGTAADRYRITLVTLPSPSAGDVEVEVPATERSAKITGLRDETTYVVAITALNGDDSARVELGSFRTPDHDATALPGSVRSLDVITRAPHRVRVGWRAPLPGASGLPTDYSVELLQNGRVLHNVRSPYFPHYDSFVGHPTVTFLRLSHSTRYAFRVRSWLDGRVGPWSPVHVFTTPAH